ncbi:hypothetical protein GCM10027589_31450 [Actinocorallia lasiicapitis]
MQVVEIGTFLLSRRFSMSKLHREGVEGTRNQITATLTEISAGFDVEAGTLLLDYHRSQGAQQIETYVFWGMLDPQRLGLEWVRSCTVYISSLSVGFVVVEIDVPDDVTLDFQAQVGPTGLKFYELALEGVLRPLIADWCRRIEEAVDCVELPLDVSLPRAKMLWWHRILIAPGPELEPATTKVYGRSCELESGVCTVGNGFTSISTADLGPKEVFDVVAGLVIATEEWLVLDESNRSLSAGLVQLGDARLTNYREIEGYYEQILELTEEIALRNLLMTDGMRYLANARARVHEAAFEIWQMGRESSLLEERTNQLRELFGVHQQRVAAHREDSRNSMILAFTVLTLVQSVLAWYVFLVEDDTSMAEQPRPVMAFAVLAISVTFLGQLCYRLITRRRRGN